MLTIQTQMACDKNNISFFQENTGNYCPEEDCPGGTEGEAPGGLPGTRIFPCFSESMKHYFCYLLFVFVL